jgi:hypothetical protein
VSKFAGAVVEDEALVVVVVDEEEAVTWTEQAARPMLAPMTATAVSQLRRRPDRAEAAALGKDMKPPCGPIDVAEEWDVTEWRQGERVKHWGVPMRVGQPSSSEVHLGKVLSRAGV